MEDTNNRVRRFAVVTYQTPQDPTELRDVARHVEQMTGLPVLVLDDGASLDFIEIEDDRPTPRTTDPRLWKVMSKDVGPVVTDVALTDDGKLLVTKTLSNSVSID